MNSTQIMADKTAISLSFLCVLHCAAMPLLVAFSPSLAGLPLQDERFHLLLVFVVLPLSIYALTMGCKKHSRKHILILGGIGLFILTMTVLLGHEKLGEIWEKTFTIIGSIFVAFGHICNYQLCKSHEHCQCPEHQ